MAGLGLSCLSCSGFWIGVEGSSAFDLHLHGGEGLGFGGAHREGTVAVVGLDGIAVDAALNAASNSIKTKLEK